MRKPHCSNLENRLRVLRAGQRLRFRIIGDASSLIDQMATAGGFTATKLAYARDILKDMKAEITLMEMLVKSPTGYLSLPPFGRHKGILCQVHKAEMFNMEQQHVECLTTTLRERTTHYYHGAFELDDIGWESMNVHPK